MLLDSVSWSSNDTALLVFQLYLPYPLLITWLWSVSQLEHEGAGMVGKNKQDSGSWEPGLDIPVLMSSVEFAGYTS